jgi:16S rRNA (guanine1516-N2)-methyltransferase
LLERSPDVHELLRDSMAKASAAGPELAAVVARMKLIFGDARKLLADLQADVVLVDPMHPVRKNTALVKKEMRLLKEVVGTDSDAAELMQAALAARCRRVVLKWPLRAPALAGLRKPSHTIAAKTVRYDVFMKSIAARQHQR